MRQEGAFIYEEFAMTMGTDIKVYAVGEAYCHAEGRKSPVVDGVVLVPSGMCSGLSPLLTRCGSSSSLSLSPSHQRDSDGKEVRFPVVLTLKEKDMCRRVS